MKNNDLMSRRMRDALKFGLVIHNLSDDRIRSLHLELLEKAVKTGRLSMIQAESAVGEASLLARLTREVERRTQSANGLVIRFFRRKSRQVWNEHGERVHKLELDLEKLARDQDLSLD